METHIRPDIRSVFPSDQSRRCLHEESLGPYLPVAKFHGVSLRNFSANFRRVSPQNFAEKTLGEICDFYFSPRKVFCFRAMGIPRRNAKKSFFLGLICTRLDTVSI